jgi:16S rRNA (guanine1207-N2)-methyltransferase
MISSRCDFLRKYIEGQSSPVVKLQANLLCETVAFSSNDHILVLNSASDAFVQYAITQQAHAAGSGILTLAEDNIAATQAALRAATATTAHVQSVPFHDYLTRMPAGTMDVAVMNLLYQPGNRWMLYGLQVALHALCSGGRLYVVGAKERGILTIAKRMQEYFGNAETLEISKGQRVLCARKNSDADRGNLWQPAEPQLLPVFAGGSELQQPVTVDEGTRLLLAALDVRTTDIALDIGCGAGSIGLHIARLASKGQVTMVDVSLAAVATAQEAARASGLTNVRVLPSDGAQAVLNQRFDLVATNPPFHQGGIQTTAIAERFIREAAQVLRPQGRFYLVANRFLKYEPTLRACFKHCEEVGGNTRYKVLHGW